MKTSRLKCSLLLFISAAIWGMAFAVQRKGMDYIGPFTFTFFRSVLGSLALLPAALLSSEKSESSKTLFIGGAVCGIALGVATCLQQYGLLYTTAGKAGFISVLYIIMIPLAGMFFGRRCPTRIWLSVIAATAGTALLCLGENFSINNGDIYEFLCAVGFTVQIMAVSHFSSRVNAYKFTCIEFMFCALTSAVPMLMTETVSLGAVCSAWLPLLYMGILSSGIGYTFQIIGERGLPPTVAALIMSLESCIAVIGGWLILGQTLSAREALGCIIMFAAIITAQLPGKTIDNVKRHYGT